jgi:hypothetical protein
MPRKLICRFVVCARLTVGQVTSSFHHHFPPHHHPPKRLVVDFLKKRSGQEETMQKMLSGMHPKVGPV